MATNLYLLRREPNFTPGSYRGTWDGTAISSGNIVIDTNKYGTGPNALISSSASMASTPYAKATLRGVSRVLEPQTIDGTVDLVIGVDENGSASQNYWKLHIYVVNATADTVLGTLLSNYAESSGGGGTEFPQTPNTGRALQSAQALSSVVVPSDANEYRIVAEIGYTSYRTAPSIVNSRMRIGARDSDNSQLPDLTVGDITPSDSVGFLVFSDTITFEATVPPNQDPETAIDIGTLPYSATIDPIYGYPTRVWYKFTPTIDTVLSILCCNSANDTELQVHTGNGIPLTLVISNSGGAPHLWPVEVGTDIYFEIYVGSYSTFLFSVLAAPVDTIEVGDLIISEDYGHAGDNIYDPTYRGLYPYTWYSDTGTVRYVSAKFPATELGCCLSNGIWGILDMDNLDIFLYNLAPTLTYIGRFPVSGTVMRSMATDFDFFYVLTAPDASASTGSLYKVTDAGVVSGPIATALTASSMVAAGSGGNSMSAVSRDGLILYYPDTIVNGVVHRHDLVGNTPLSSFTSPGAGYIPGDIVVMSDGTIAAIFYTSLVNKVAHYSAAGTLLNLWDFGTTPWNIHHITHEGTDDADKLWVWTQDEYSSLPSGVGLSKLQLLELSTGDILKEFTKDSFLGGVGPLDDAGTCSPSERFGAPDSCPLMVVMSTSSPPPTTDRSGIYYINPTKATKHDSYYGDVETKIPNPTIRTGLFGE